MAVFKHVPIDLEGPSIRLLRLLKRKDSDVECEIFQAWLDDDRALSYEALSYTWGGTDLAASVKINGKTFGVTENLYLALQYLCLQETDRILWVDAICIDQVNEEERGHQVQHMGGIYSHAHQVLFWLGSPTDETNALMRSLNRLEEESIKYACRNWKLEDKRWTYLWSSVQPLLRNEFGYVAAQQHAGLVLLLRRPWFKRVWILQEVANAKRAVVCCGAQSVSARIFALAPLLLATNLEPHCQSVLDIMPGPSREDSWWSQKRDLHTLLLKFNKSEANDPRDMIYALLGISSDVCGSDILVPDYKKSVNEVIHDTVAFFLYTRGWTDSMPGFPQWSLKEFLRDLESIDHKLFVWTVENGHEAIVKLLLDTAKLNVNAVSRNSEETPLWKAIKHGHEVIVKLLLDTGKVDVNAVRYGKTPLWEATENGQEGIVKLLLDTDNVDVNPKDENGRTLLFRAVANGYQAIVKLLLDTGKVDKEAQDYQDRQTPLWKAVERGNEAIVKLMLDTGKVDVNWKDIRGRTPLWEAVASGDETIVKLLLKVGKTNLNIEDDNEETPLWKAVENGNEAIVKLLLDTGKVDVNSKDMRGRTPLWKAAGKGHVVIVKELLDIGKAKVNAQDKDGVAPLWRAAVSGHDAVVRLLLDTGKAKIDLRDSRWGGTPLWRAAENGHEAVVKLLLNTGKANVNLMNEDGIAPLWRAAEKGHETVVKLLINTDNTNIDLRGSRWGVTPLWRAAEFGHEAVVKLLLDTGKVDVNSKDRSGRTPLWMAAGNGHEAIVRLLLDTGKADIDAKDHKSGQTPLCKATANGYELVVKLLKSAGKPS